MIICIDLKPYDCGMAFSFFNTVGNAYLIINDNQSWDSISDLVDDLNLSKSFYDKKFQSILIDKIFLWGKNK